MSNFFCLQLRLCKIFDKFQVWMNISWLTLDWHNYLCAIVSISFFQTMTFSSWNRSDTLFFLLLWIFWAAQLADQFRYFNFSSYLVSFFYWSALKMTLYICHIYRTKKLWIEQKSYKKNKKAIERTEKLSIEQKSYR